MKNLIPPMLAYDATSNPKLIDKIIDSPKSWIIQPKIDGIRIITYISENEIISYSRNLKEYPCLAEYLRKYIDTSKIDCEYYIDGEIFYKNIRYTVSKLSTCKCDGLVYHVFDIIIRNIPYNKRILKLKKFIHEYVKNKKIIKFIHGNLIPYKSADKVREYIFNQLDINIKKGYEGIMLKNLDSLYESKRVSSWIKLKKHETLDLIIVDVIESNTNPNTLGAIVVDSCGNYTKVGSGFTQEERYRLWRDREKIINKIAEVKYFERTPDNKLRFPIFIRIRDDKDQPDCITE